jgi:hypothetical protein
MAVKSKKNRRNLKGGASDIMSFFSNAWNQTKKTSKGLFDNISQQTSNILGNKSSSTIPNNTNTNSNTNTNTNTNINNSNNISTGIRPNYSYNNNNASTSGQNNSISSSIGGKKKRKGGAHAPVSGLKVAKPSYWITGGRKSRKSKKSRKSNKSKTMIKK